MKLRIVKVNRNSILFLGLLIVVIGFFSFTLQKNIKTTQYKCLVQLANYEGEGAYMSVSVINSKNEYTTTLYVMGYDYDWYPELINWWRFEENKNTDFDAVSGATISGGERKIFTLNINNNYINNGYKLRFETAVEDGEYYSKDVELPLNSSNLERKFEGEGYIRYIRLANSK